MNINYRKLRTDSRIIVLLSALVMSQAVNAAKYNEAGDFWPEGGGDFSNSFSELLMFESNLAQVKREYQLIIGLIKQKEFVRAKEKIALLIKKNPKQSNFYFLKAFLEITNKEKIEAKKSLQQAIELNSENALAYAGLAKLALDDKQYEQAKEYASKAVEISPHSLDGYTVLADVAMQQHGINAAEKVLLNAYAEVKGDFKTELGGAKLLAKIYINKKQPEKMLSLIADLVARYPNELPARSALVSVQLENQDAVGAEQTLRQIIFQHPKDAKHLFLLARLLDERNGKSTEILTLLDTATLNLDNPALVLAYKTSYLIKQKQFKQAFTVAKQLDEANPRVSIGKILKGDVYMAEKKYEQALVSYQEAYEIMPTTNILEGMLAILTIQNKQEDAIVLLEQVLAKNKDNMDIQFKLAGRYQNAGKYDLSIKLYEALLLKQKDNANILNNLAWAYGQQKNPKALALSKKAFEKAPKSGVIADTYGYLLLKNGYTKKSLKILKRAAELAPKEIDIQLHLAEAYGANDKKMLAREILQQVINANDKGKLAAIKLLEQM